MASGKWKGRFGRGIRKGISSPLSLTSSPAKGRSALRVASFARRWIAGDVLVLEGCTEVEVVRNEVSGVVGRAFLGKVVEMRIGLSESRRWEAIDGRERLVAVVDVVDI